MPIEWWVWPTLGATVFYGIGDGLYKQYIEQIHPHRLCLYSVPVSAVVYLCFIYFFGLYHPPPFAPEGRAFLFWSLLTGLFYGVGNVVSYEGILRGPISLLSPVYAAYPIVTAVLAPIFLDEVLLPRQYAGVGLVLVGCLLLAYDPSQESREYRTGAAEERTEPGEKAPSKYTWLILAAVTAILWGVGAVLNSYAYEMPQANYANFMLFMLITSVPTLALWGLVRERTLPENQRWKYPAVDFPPAILALGTYALGDVAVYLAYEEGPATVVTALSGAYPAVTLPYAFFVLGERPTRLQWSCIALILLGTALAAGEV
ncbi:MAG: DMT family transporter [Acidobacteriota bacterium]|nr:MAG: DMT family transporter [Acidobacteriota bacterium]